MRRNKYSHIWQPRSAYEYVHPPLCERDAAFFAMLQDEDNEAATNNRPSGTSDYVDEGHLLNYWDDGYGTASADSPGYEEAFYTLSAPPQVRPYFESTSGDMAFDDDECFYDSEDTLSHFERESEYRRAVRAGNNVPDWMLLNRFQDGGFHFGIKSGLAPLTYVGKPQNRDGHILMVGGSGSGKTSAIVIPTLYTWNGHVIVLDIKPNGGLLSHCQRAGAFSGKRVMVFNPIKKDSYGYDPYTFLRYDDERNLTSNAMDLASALIPLPPETRDPVWITAARNLLSATILYHIDINATFSQTMITILNKSAEDLITEIEKSGNAAAQLFIGKLKHLEPKIMAGVDIDLAGLAIFAADPHVNFALGGKEESNIIEWKELNTSTNPLIIVLQLPEEYLEVWEPMTKLLISQLIRTLERRADIYTAEGKILPPILIMCEEFTSLGSIPSIKSGLSTLRSRGVTFCLVIQTFSQLDEVYGKSARQVIIDNFTYKIVLNISDPESQKYFSDMIGNFPVANRSLITSCYSAACKDNNYCLTESREPIVHPHELCQLSDKIVLITPEGFCRVDKDPYYKSRNMGLYGYADIQ